MPLIDPAWDKPSADLWVRLDNLTRRIEALERSPFGNSIATFTYYGALANTSILGPRFYCEHEYLITDVRASVNTPGTGTTVRVYKNSAALTDIVLGSGAVTAAVLGTTLGDAAEVLEGEFFQVGIIVAGGASDLTVQVRMKRLE